MRRLIPGFLFVAFSLLGTATQGRAEVIFDNLGNLNFNTISANSTSWAAQRFFTGSTSYELSSVVLLMNSTSPGNPLLQIYGGSDTAPSSSPLFTLTNPGSISGTLANNTFTAGSTFLMDANTNYWVVLKGVGSSSFEWGYTQSNDGIGNSFRTQNAITNNSGVPWLSYPDEPFQMQVNATAVPEPGTLTLGTIAMVSGGVGTWWRRRKAKATSGA